MRRLPSSWSTTFVRLGLRRHARRTTARRRPCNACKLGFESLESRQVLTTFFVNVAFDEPLDATPDGQLTLREALQAANTDAPFGDALVGGSGADVIQFNLGSGAHTILLTQGELASTGEITVAGPGSSLLTIDASGNDPTGTSTPIDASSSNDFDGSRVFRFDVGGSVSGMTLTGGDVAGSGGAISFGFGGEPNSLTDVIVRDNYASQSGGGIFGSFGFGMQISNSKFLDNMAASNGGGVQVDFQVGDVAVEGSQFSGNRALGGNGGGFSLFGANDIRFEDNLFSGNSALAAGGLQVSSEFTFEFLNTDVLNNIATSGRGGGLQLFRSTQGETDSRGLIKSSTFSGNQSTDNGGGLYIDGNLSVEILESDIIGNTTTTGSGGGVYWYADSPSPTSPLDPADAERIYRIKDSNVLQNVASGGSGGGIFVDDVGAYAQLIEISSSTFANNEARGGTGEGGGLYVVDTFGARESVLHIANSTFSENSSTAVGGGLYFGPRSRGLDLIENVTITQNESTQGAGLVGHGDVVLISTIVSGNTLPSSPTASNILGEVSDASSFNLIGTGGSGGLVDGDLGNIVGVNDPQLGPLTVANGGHTATHSPGSGSLVIDRGSPTTPFDPADFDQRGHVRVQNGQVDIGAVETTGTLNPRVYDKADIVILVDQSGSSQRQEQDWLARMVLRLDAELAMQGVASNRYGLIGFGHSPFSSHFAFSHLLNSNLTESVVGLSQRVNTVHLSGGDEDAWEALEHAVAEYDFRTGAAVNFILVTDEDRDIKNPSLTSDDVSGTPENESLAPTAILPVIKSRNAVVTAVLAGNYAPDNSGDLVFAVLPETVDPEALERLSVEYTGSGVSPNTTFHEEDDYEAPFDSPTILENYHHLAWSTEGSVWNDNIIKQSDNPTVRAFTKEFTKVLTTSVVEQIGRGNVYLPAQVEIAIDFGASAAPGFPNSEPFFPGNNVLAGGSIDTNSKSIPVGTTAVFQTAREAADGTNIQMQFGAAQDIHNGIYHVELFFAEIDDDSSRQFDVVIEGKTVLNNYAVHNDWARIEDINSDIDGRLEVMPASFNTGVVKVFEVEVIDGVLNIALNDTGGSQGPMLSALRILKDTDPPPSADFDHDGDVDGRDFLIWQRGYGTVDALQPDGDANYDGFVDGLDRVIWQQQYGTNPGDVIASADFDGDGDVDGRDFLTWQRGYALTNQTHNTNGDANFDGFVDGADLVVFQLQYGTFESPVLAIKSDYDNNGMVDANDYLIWQENNGLTSASQAQGDATGDGIVNGRDLLAWELEYSAVHPNGYPISLASVSGANGLAPGQILVTSLADEIDGDFSLGDLTLREALAIAAATPQHDTIVFASDLSGTINLTSELTLGSGYNSDITIEGPGAATVSINAESAWLSHVFNVTNYATVENFTVRNLRLTGSSSGAIRVQGSPNRHLMLDGVEISDNWGTGVLVEGGDLTVTNSKIMRNWVYGIDFSGYGELIVENTSVYDNEGIGIGVANSMATIVNSTISGNHTSDEAGGVWVNGSTALLTNVTIANNDGSTGGLYSTRGGVATLHNTIVVGNTSGPAASDIGLSSFWGNGSIGAASSYNLIGVAPSGSIPSGNGNQTGVSVASLGLAPLGEYGGATPTHMLLTGSIALNAGNNSNALDVSGAALVVDQRGQTRITGAAVDIGAVEGSSGVVLTVGTLADENDSNHSGSDYSLREALDDASSYAGVETIQFAQGLTGTLTLSLGQLVVDSNLNLFGPGADELTISGNNVSRVVNVNSGVTASITGLRIAGGYVASNGGGILSAGNLTLNRVAIEDNFSYAGGGLYASGVLNVVNSTIADNTGYYVGGGAHLTLATAIFVNATVSSNSASYGGGGLYISGGSITIAHGTVTQNRSTTSNSGGGIYVSSGGVVVHHTIIADNFYGTGSVESDIYGTLNTSLSVYNLIGTGGSGGLTNNVNGNLVGVADPGLAALDFYGGPIRTHALLAGSAAIDAGNEYISSPPSSDARGRARIDDGDYDYESLIDIGAFELAADEYFGSLGA
jgi:hypothetical protein